MAKPVQEKCTILLVIPAINHLADKMSLSSVLPQLEMTHLQQGKAYCITNSIQIGLWQEKDSLEGAFYIATGTSKRVKCFQEMIVAEKLEELISLLNFFHTIVKMEPK